MHAPGWYQDPHNHAVQRWWDGRIWTEHTRPQGPSAAPQSYPGHVGVPQQVPTAPSSNRMAVAVPHVGHAFQSPAAGPLQAQIQEAEHRLALLRKELESVEEAIQIQSFGFYRPKYGFQSADEYERRLEQVREDQKAMVKSGTATFCDTKWEVGGSAAEGRKMIERMSKLMLRAFNGECDATIAKVRYDNIEKFEQRITKSCEEINKLGHSNRVMITRPYYESKLAELRLVHEHREKLQEEKEEQRRIREQLKEEEKARLEIEKAKADAERDEADKTKALEKARSELEAAAANEKQHARLALLVDRLESELKEAIERKARAMSRAQLTRSGWVYVLSNVGSFGEGVYKIGLTRRLKPEERVDELGDASVPFCFDIHAVIYTEDAPALEAALHREFADRRVNRVNLRKEYFRVTLSEIQAAVKKHHTGVVSMVLDAEAEEWRKTVAMLNTTESA